MMYSVGYSLIAEQQFNEAIYSFKDHIAEIYFSWPGMKSGRANIVYNDEDYQQKVIKLLDDLSRYADMGIPLAMLFNANCYGGEAISKQLEKLVIETIEFVQNKVACLKAVITASPFIASKIKLHFSDIQIRASVNMRINSTFAMDYLSDRFDFFYVAKELNRDIVALKNLKAWATAHGKQIGILVNSGCLNNCPNQTFHDNLVAHESEIKNYDTSYYQPVLCRKFIAKQNNWHFLIEGSNWIRPEDITEYQEIFQTVKLATRMHSNPFMVIGAYSHGAHYGNILDLMEPGFSGILHPYILDNSKFPKKWSSGGANLKEDSSSLLEKVLIKHQLL